MKKDPDWSRMSRMSPKDDSTKRSGHHQCRVYWRLTADMCKFFCMHSWTETFWLKKSSKEATSLEDEHQRQIETLWNTKVILQSNRLKLPSLAKSLFGKKVRRKVEHCHESACIHVILCKRHIIKPAKMWLEKPELVTICVTSSGNTTGISCVTSCVTAMLLVSKWNILPNVAYERLQ